MAENKNRSADNDRFFFRNEGLPSTANVPRDMTWALIEENGVDTSTPGGGSSYVGEVIYNEKTGEEQWQPHNPVPIPDPGVPQLPTPFIREVLSQRVSQNSEGAARTSVFFAVICVDNVEYEVMVTPA